MIKRKSTKSRGKLKLSKYFQEFETGDRVAIVREHALNPAFPFRIQGKSGVISGQKGSYYVIKLMDGNEEKTYIIAPAHLKKVGAAEIKSK